MLRLLLTLTVLLSMTQAQEYLTSWNDGKSKQEIMEFVQKATDPKSVDFIPVADRIAVFDNDGTLWSEQPAYFQLFFAIDRVKELAPQHPEWKTTQPFKAVLEDDMKAMMASGTKGLLEMVVATHTGMTDKEFDATVVEWINKAKHPRFDRLYKDLVYQPMLELLTYLRANDFKTFIVSGGGIDFMRPFVSEVYGIPSEQIVGSMIEVAYENKQIVRKPKLTSLDDGAVKPVNIHYHIGKQPVASFGNSDGDFAMMEYTASNTKYKTLQLYVHHTDEKREWAYDRKSHIGKFDKGLDYALKNNWTLVDMKNDWKVVYPFELNTK